MERLLLHFPEPYVAQLERGVNEGRPDYISANLPWLRQIIRSFMDWQEKIAQMEYRARRIIEQHEPSASERLTRGQ